MSNTQVSNPHLSGARSSPAGCGLGHSCFGGRQPGSPSAAPGQGFDKGGAGALARRAVVDLGHPVIERPEVSTQGGDRFGVDLRHPCLGDTQVVGDLLQ